MLNLKSSQNKGKVIAQVGNHEVKVREEKKEGFTKDSKTWTQVISKFSNANKYMQYSAIKERAINAANVIVKGVKYYGKNECTLDLASDFLNGKLLWQG